MPRPEMPAIETASLRARIDPASHARGLRYAGQGAVVQFRWDTAQCALQGLVRGSGGAFYTTIAYFSPGSRAALRFSGGDCSCPVGGDCKHVVALVVTATSTAGDPLPAVPAPAPAWQASIDGLLAGPAAAARPGQLPLALELALAPAQAEQYRTAGTPPGTPAVPRLTARLLEPRGAGWTGGSLSWSRLDTLQYYGGYQAAQVRLLRELYALYGSGLVAYYGYRDEKRIDLGAFESRQLWPLLDEAVLAGVRLVRRGRLGELPAVADAEICLDVRAAPDGRLVIGAVTGGLPAAAVPVRFIGSDGGRVSPPSARLTAAPPGACPWPPAPRRAPRRRAARRSCRRRHRARPRCTARPIPLAFLCAAWLSAAWLSAVTVDGVIDPEPSGSRRAGR